MRGELEYSCAKNVTRVNKREIATKVSGLGSGSTPEQRISKISRVSTNALPKPRATPEIRQNHTLA